MIIIELEYLLINSDKEEKEANQKHLYFSNIIEAETKTTTEHGLVMGIITPLNMASIAL